MDDFEAFRKKKIQDKKREAEGEKNAKAQDEALGWVEGLGPSGPANPKVKGFILGRYRRRRVDPKALQKPKGFQTHKRSDGPPGTERKPTPPEELEGRDRVKGIQKY